MILALLLLSIGKISFSNEKTEILSMLNKGFEFMEGKNNGKNYLEASKWFSKAAEKGSRDAFYMLAIIKSIGGYGVEKDINSSNKFFRKSAELGQAISQDMLGNFYFGGNRGFSQDYEKAYYWYEKAAEQGFSDSQASIGIMLENGHGTKKNQRLACHYFELSANDNNPRGKKFLKTSIQAGRCEKKN